MEEEFNLRELHEFRDILLKNHTFDEEFEDCISEYVCEIITSIALEGDNGFTWRPQQSTCTARQNIEEIKYKVLGEARRNSMNPNEYWYLLMDDNMLNIIWHTLKDGLNQKKLECGKDSSDIRYKELSFIEMQAFIGLLYLVGLSEKSYTFYKDLWKSNILLQSFDVDRFTLLLSFLININITKQEFNQEDENNFGTLRKLWHEFNINCQKYYSPSQYCMIDDKYFQLPPSYYMFKKNLYTNSVNRLRITIMNDSSTLYMLNAVPRFETIVEPFSPDYYLKQVSLPIHNTNRTIITNTSYTSVEIFQIMFRKNNRTMIGAIRGNNKYIPYELKLNRDTDSSLFYYNEDKGLTLVSNIPKDNKVLLLLSSLNLTKTVEGNEDPDIVNIYKQSKIGSHGFNNFCQQYSTSKAWIYPSHKHWSLQCFFYLLDCIAINAFVLYTCNDKNEKLERKQFLQKISMGLIIHYFTKRSGQ